MKYLACLFLLLTGLPVAAQDTLLKKQPDGSILITPENAWAVFRGRCSNYNNLYLTDDRMATQLWEYQLFAIKDEFARHDFMAKQEHLLDDATAQAKSIGDVTLIFYPGVGDYDFDSQAYPIGGYGNDGARNFPGSVYVTFERTLASKIQMPEAQAKSLADALRTDHGFVECIVKGTIKDCRSTTSDERGGAQAKAAEEEPTNDMYKMILTVSSVEYRLKTTGIVLLSKSFTDPATSSAAATSPSP